MLFGEGEEKRLFLRNIISQAPPSNFKKKNSSQKYHRTACVPGTVTVTEINMNFD